MKIFSLTFILLAFISTRGLAADNANLNYVYTDVGTKAGPSIILNDILWVFGPERFMAFNEKLSVARFSGPHKIDGYAQYIRKLPDDTLIIAGLNYKGFDILGKDTRQGIILKWNPKKLSDPVEKFIELGKTSHGLEINAHDQPVLLSSKDGYTLTIFSTSLNKLNSVPFGSGGAASMAITDQNNYVVIGFDHNENSSGIVPTYWEYSSDLKLITKKQLTSDTRPSGSNLVAINVLPYKDSLYLIYGWDRSGIKKENPDEVTIKKMQNGTDIWEQKIPYHHNMVFYVSNNGALNALYGKVDNIHQFIFNAEDGKKTTKILNRPTTPVQCFPPEWKYDLVEVLSSDKKPLLVIRGDPLNHAEAGCTTVAEIN
ncbi:MAG: hypothetical protein DYH13_05255 [Alphaproteobacteria bacterium PRO2]|nr:hypothetical protein [Alphaproteobacteria bacterium PRO2]